MPGAAMRGQIVSLVWFEPVAKKAVLFRSADARPRVLPQNHSDVRAAAASALLFRHFRHSLLLISLKCPGRQSSNRLVIHQTWSHLELGDTFNAVEKIQ